MLDVKVKKKKSKKKPSLISTTLRFHLVCGVGEKLGFITTAAELPAMVYTFYNSPSALFSTPFGKGC